MASSAPAQSLVEKIISIGGPLPKQKEARAFSLFAIAGAMIACALTLYFGAKGEAFMGRHLGGDFLQYYSAGWILNHFEPAKLYDVPFLSKIEHETLASFPKNQVGIYGYAPWMANMFRPLAALPYIWGYCVWLVFSAGLYALGMWMLLRGRLPADYTNTAWLLACSAPMFTFETWIGGQTSVVAFFAAACFVRAFENGRLFIAGLALGLFAYKPSLLAIPLLIMVLLRCWSMLAGVVVTTSVTVLASLATGGTQGMRLWFSIMDVYKYLATSGDGILRRNKYVDLNSFFAILMGESALVRYFSYVVIAAALTFLARAAWNARVYPEAHRYIWAGALIWTQIINIYVPVYDTVLLIPALALAAPMLLGSKHVNDRHSMGAWLVALWLLPWLTQASAEFLRVQLFTLLLAGCGWWMLELARQKSSARVTNFEQPLSAELFAS